MRIILFLLLQSFAQAQSIVRVQVGQTWDRKPAVSIYKQSVAVLLQKSHGQDFYRGSAFYIGKHFGKHVVITNQHLLRYRCSKTFFVFSEYNNQIKKFRCKKILNSWGPEVGLDLALVELNIKEEDNDFFNGKALKIDWNWLPSAGQRFRSIGAARRDAHMSMARFYLTEESSRWCRLFSKEREFVEISSIQLRYAFVTGCDASHGDSGSPIFDYASGYVVGILSAISEVSKLQSDEDLDEIMGSDLDQLIPYFSYALALSPIKSILGRYIEIP